MQAERDEAHHQHDDHRLDQNAHELADRARNGSRLVLHLNRLDAHRQRLLDSRQFGAQRVAESDDVATLGHRNAECDHRLALVPHLDRRRVDIAALDFGDVRQAQRAGRAGRRVDAADRETLQLLDRTELAADAHLQVFAAGIQYARAFDRVLRAELRDDLVQVETERGQPLVRYLDVQPLRLHAEQLDLGHVGHAQQLLAHRLGVPAQFFV